MQITMLGTGNALVTECYNTCFVMRSESGNILIDTGGGNYILHQLKRINLDLQDIHNIFITHAHIDHILGLIWIIRISAQRMNKNIFNGDLNIYSHDEVLSLVQELANKLLLPYQAGFIGKRIHLIEIKHDETRIIAGQEFKFFDIHSNRTKQFGFCMNYDGSKKLTCCGDEPCKESSEIYAINSDWLLHEAFCLYSQAEIFRPYEKNHSTVKDASTLAQRLNIKNLLLYHTEDANLSQRRELYTNESKQYFTGKIFIPDDLETLTL
ncbi:MAG: MBL fold metallo-hydrolase [Synergistaceae bacterium]|nr:MBL fold metallo-hydrolase [Synergistaceae bacterium]